MALLITITDAGRAEIINADNTGTGPVVITEIGFGTGQYAPSKTQTALTAEVKRVSSIAGQVVADDTIHVVAKDEGPDAYNVGEFGLFSTSGTLVAVYSQVAASGWIIQKAGAATLLLAVDIILESLDAASLTFGDISFTNPPATTETPGVVQLEDSLTSPSVAKALTAKQGKALQDGKQPLHANLTAFSGLEGVADRLHYFTGAGALSLTTLSAFARTLLDDANATAALATLGAAPLASPALTGTPTAPTAAAGTNTPQLATTAFVAAVKTLLDAAIDLKAPLASPALTGTPTAPTAAQATNNTQLATTAFVKAAIAALLDSAPGTLDTLNELAAALGDDPNFATTMTNALAGKQPLDATLTALAALATAADKLIYATDADQFATATLTAKARTLLASADESAMRAFLGLVKQTGQTDSGAGRVMLTGAFGLGGALIATDMDTVAAQPTGFYSTSSGAGLIFTPPSGLDVNGIIWNQVRAAAGASAQASQLWVHQSTGRMFRRSAFSNAWSEWKEDWNSANLSPTELSPPGAVAHFARNTAPGGWLKANGAAVSRSTYAALFAAIGTTFGAGDGSTTFNLPDLRGEFVRGWDDGRGIDSGRALGTFQAGTTHAHASLVGATGAIGSAWSDGLMDGSGAGGSKEEFARITAANGGATFPTGTTYQSNGADLWTFKSRPRNVALLACIKY